MAARVRRWGHREYCALPACHAPCLSSKQSQKRHYCQTCVCSSQGLGGQMDRFLLRPCAVLVAAALAQLCLSVKGVAQQPDSQLVTLQPDPASDVLPFYRDWTKRDEPALSEPALSREQTIEHLRAAIKYVFVIFQENESFDHYFRDVSRRQWNLLGRPASAHAQGYARRHPNISEYRERRDGDRRAVSDWSRSKRQCA